MNVKKERDFEINASVVESLFTKLNVKKAAGPR